MDWIVGGWIAMMITSMTYNALGPQSVPLEYAFVFGLYALRSAS